MDENILYEALRSPIERRFLLQVEREILLFLENSRATILRFSPLPVPLVALLSAVAHRYGLASREFGLPNHLGHIAASITRTSAKASPIPVLRFEDLFIGSSKSSFSGKKGIVEADEEDDVSDALSKSIKSLSVSEGAQAEELEEEEEEEQDDGECLNKKKLDDKEGKQKSKRNARKGRGQVLDMGFKSAVIGVSEASSSSSSNMYEPSSPLSPSSAASLLATSVELDSIGDYSLFTEIEWSEVGALKSQEMRSNTVLVTTDHILEAAGIPLDLKPGRLESFFAEFNQISSSSIRIRWVNREIALIVFSSIESAQQTLKRLKGSKDAFFHVHSFAEACQAAKQWAIVFKGKEIPSPLPSAPSPPAAVGERPPADTRVARRMIISSLGISRTKLAEKLESQKEWKDKNSPQQQDSVSSSSSSSAAPRAPVSPVPYRKEQEQAEEPSIPAHSDSSRGGGRGGRGPSTRGLWEPPAASSSFAGGRGRGGATQQGARGGRGGSGRGGISSSGSSSSSNVRSHKAEPGSEYDRSIGSSEAAPIVVPLSQISPSMPLASISSSSAAASRDFGGYGRASLGGSSSSAYVPSSAPLAAPSYPTRDWDSQQYPQQQHQHQPSRSASFTPRSQQQQQQQRDIWSPSEQQQNQGQSSYGSRRTGGW